MCGCIESVQKRVNAGNPGRHFISYLAVLWHGGRSCSGSCWFHIWCTGKEDGGNVRDSNHLDLLNRHSQETERLLHKTVSKPGVLQSHLQAYEILTSRQKWTSIFTESSVSAELSGPFICSSV